VLLKAPEAAIKQEQVAPKAAEVAELPVPVAPMRKRKRKSLPKAAEADVSARSLRARMGHSLNQQTRSYRFKPCAQITE
jgi:hypothetical protein